jgi:predicted esterase
VCAYNVACAWSLSRDRERAFAWFERAVANGFGDAADRIQTASKDADVAFLRADPRWPGLVERMHARSAEARLASSAFELREPDRNARVDADADVARPLLVVLHAEGGTPADVLEGRWAELADELGVLLLAPAGELPGVGAGGLRWYEDLDDLVRRPLEAGERVLTQVREVCERHAVDPRRVVLGGERSAAPLAFDVAVRAPGLFSGVLLVDGPPLPEVAEQRTRTAALLGLRVELAFTDARPPWPGTLPAAELARRSASWLAARGLGPAAVEPETALAVGAVHTALERLLERGATRTR